jgi:hypothetical protein
LPLALDPQKLPARQELQYSLNLKIGKAQAIFRQKKENEKLEFFSEITVGTLGFTLFKLNQRALWSGSALGPELYEEKERHRDKARIFRYRDGRVERESKERGNVSTQAPYDFPMESSSGDLVQPRSFLDPLSIIFALQTRDLKKDEDIPLQILGHRSPIFLKIRFIEEKNNHVPALRPEETTQLRVKLEFMGGEVGKSFSIINDAPIYLWLDQPTGIISEFGGQYGGYSLSAGRLEKSIRF